MCGKGGALGTGGGGEAYDQLTPMKFIHSGITQCPQPLYRILVARMMLHSFKTAVERVSLR